MDTKKAIIIGLSAVVLIGGTVALMQVVKNNRKNEGGESEGEDANIDTSDSQTKGEIGKLVKTHPTLGYTNVRTSPNVDDGWLGTWFGYRPTDGNFIGKATSNPIGTVKRALTGDDGHIWYQVKLSKPLNGKSEGYVRQDAVQF